MKTNHTKNKKVLLKDIKTAALLFAGFTSIAHFVHNNAVKNGFWKGGRTDAECIALIHSELSEALEELREPMIPSHPYAPRKHIRRGREPKPEGFPSEMADVIIRTLDLCAARNIDIGRAVMDKVIYNNTRPYKHGKRF